MPKGGSGFRRGASRSAGNLLKGKSRDWRISDRAAASKYRDEIVKLYESMYRSGMTVQRDNRGNMTGYGGGDDALQRAANRIGELANRIAGSVEMYDATMAREYARLRQTWGKAVRVNAQDMKEFRNQLQSGERMLINPRGGRTASDAEGRLAESGIRSDLVGNANILIRREQAVERCKQQHMARCKR